MSFISLRSYLQITVLKILNIIIWLLQIILNWRKINIYFSRNFYRNENSLSIRWNRIFRLDKFRIRIIRIE